MLEVGRAVMVTSAGGGDSIDAAADWRAAPLLLGRRSLGVPYALAGPGEFSLLRKEAGSLGRGDSLIGEPNLPLPPLDDGVDGTGEFGKDLSMLKALATGSRRAAGGDHGGDF